MKQSGFTLVELMITVAIIAIISAIAIPAYNGYIQEARYSTARSNVDSLRLFLEDFRLDNTSYDAGSGTYSDVSAIYGNYGWTPRDDDGTFSYSLLASTNSFTANVSFSNTTIVSCTQTLTAYNCAYY